MKKVGNSSSSLLERSTEDSVIGRGLGEHGVGGSLVCMGGISLTVEPKSRGVSELAVNAEGGLSVVFRTGADLEASSGEGTWLKKVGDLLSGDVENFVIGCSVGTKPNEGGFLGGGNFETDGTRNIGLDAECFGPEEA